MIKKTKKCSITEQWGERTATILHFPISFSEILILRQFENNMKHILLHTNLKVDGEVEITWI